MGNELVLVSCTPSVPAVIYLGDGMPHGLRCLKYKVLLYNLFLRFFFLNKSLNVIFLFRKINYETIFYKSIKLRVVFSQATGQMVYVACSLNSKPNQRHFSAGQRRLMCLGLRKKNW